MDTNAYERPLILAPVGGAEQLKAALRTGADAVYLGAKGFNARRNAENFAETSLDEAIAQCHERGVKVFVTLNTLVTDDEFAALTAELDDIAKAQADAVIVQDMGVMSLIRARYPELPLYASTAKDPRVSARGGNIRIIKHVATISFACLFQFFYYSTRFYLFCQMF